MPLDPHRFLLLPGWHARKDDPRKRVDHLLKLDGGLGQILDNMIYEVADSQVFCHEDHDPRQHLHLDGPRLPTPWTGTTQEGPSWVIEYPTLDAGLTIERRWLSEHPPARGG